MDPDQTASGFILFASMIKSSLKRTWNIIIQHMLHFQGKIMAESVLMNFVLLANI